MIKAIIFDFGRVISAQKPLQLFRSYEDALGIARGTINRIMFASTAWDELLVGKISADDYWQRTGPLLNLHTPEAILGFRQRYHNDEAVDQGVVRLIKQLRQCYKVGVLSNCPPGLEQWLDEWQILGLFDAVLCSGNEGLVKPDPAFFRLALDRLQVRPEEAIFIDDTPGHVEASRRLGMHGLLFTTSKRLRADLRRVLAEDSTPGE